MIFPVADWAYYLLAGMSMGLGLYLSFLLAGEWLDGRKRALVPLLLSIIPFYNFLALRYDHNAALIPLWAFATWTFMRSLDSGRIRWSILAGCAAAAALLTKYWSVFLLLALALAALSHQNRARYIRSSAPWVTGLIVLLACAPHALWLIRENFPPLIIAAGLRGALSVTDWLKSLLEYSLGTAGYASLAVVLALAATRPSRQAIGDTLWPAQPECRTAAFLFWVPLLLPVPVAALTGTRLLSLWNMPALGLLPVILLMSPLIVLPRRPLVHIAAVAMGISGAALLTSPLIAWRQLAGVENHSNYARLLAAELQTEWRRATALPLKFVGGPFGLAAPMSFYLPGQPRTYYLTELRVRFEHYMTYLAPWADRASIRRDGIAVACPSTDAFCLWAMNNFLILMSHKEPREVVLSRRWLGVEGPPARFTIAVVPPSAAP